MIPAAQLRAQATDLDQRAATLTLYLDVMHQEMMTLAHRAKAIRRERDQLREDARDARAVAKAARAADRMTIRRQRPGGEAR